VIWVTVLRGRKQEEAVPNRLWRCGHLGTDSRGRLSYWWLMASEGDLPL